MHICVFQGSISWPTTESRIAALILISVHTGSNLFVPQCSNDSPHAAAGLNLSKYQLFSSPHRLSLCERRHRRMPESWHLQSDLHQLERRLQVRVSQRLPNGCNHSSVQGCGWVDLSLQVDSVLSVLWLQRVCVLGRKWLINWLIGVSCKEIEATFVVGMYFLIFILYYILWIIASNALCFDAI